MALISFLIYGNLNFAQFAKPFIRNFPPASYQSADYVSSPQNSCVIQDAVGVMCIGNQNIALSYNNKRWSAILGTNHKLFLKMAIDRHGQVFTGGLRELGCVTADSLGRLYYSSMVDRLPSEAQAFEKIMSVVADGDGLIYFLDKTWLFVWNGERMQTFKSKVAFRKAVTVDGQVMIQSKEDGIWTFVDGAFAKVAASSLADTLNIKGIFRRPGATADEWMLITYAQGLFQLNSAGMVAIPSALDSLTVWNTASLADARLALATEEDGLCILDAKRLHIEQIDEQAGLFFNSLLFPAADAEFGIWVTADIGLSRVEEPRVLRQIATSQKSKFLAMAMHKFQHKLFVGMVDGCWVLDPEALKPSMLKIDPFNDLVKVIATYEKGLLIGSAAQGVFDWKDGQLTQVSNTKVTACLRSVSEPGTLWVGMENGLSSLQWDGQQWHDGEQIPNVHHPVYDLAETPNGDVWAAFTQVSRLQYPDGRDAAPVVTTFDSTKGFTANHGDYDLWVYEGKLYFGTSRGLFSFDESKQMLVPDSTFGIRFADHHKAAHYMTEDLLGQIWLYDGDRTGVLRQNADCQWQWDDLPLRRMEDQVVWSIYPDPDSLIWIGTTTTLYCYDPRIPKDYHVPFHTLIDRVTVNDTQVVFYGNYADSAGRLVDVQPENYQLSFPFTHNDFAFSYTATSYEYPEKTVFSYWLEGLEADWSPWMPESDKAYNDLPEGHYTFHARSRNLYDTLGKEAAYTFTIRPPWYRTWWAYLLYACAAVGLVLLIVRWQVGRANRKQEAQRVVERKQQREMLQATVNAQENERSRIAKDLHDDIQVTLSTAKLKLGILSRNLKKQGQGEEETMESTALLQSAIESVREISQDLLPVALERFGLALALKELCEKVDSGEQLQVLFRQVGESQRSTKDVELAVYRVAQELFANALKHAEAERIQVCLSYTADAIVLDFEDNGKGFERSILESSGNGLGFKNMQSRISLVAGTLVVTSELGQGSRFQVRIPV